MPGPGKVELKEEKLEEEEQEEAGASPEDRCNSWGSALVRWSFPIPQHAPPLSRVLSPPSPPPARVVCTRAYLAPPRVVLSSHAS